MATVIDELIVVLGLDASKFSQGQKQALESWRKTREDARKHAQGMSKDTDLVAEAVTGLSKRLLSLGALFVGGLGVKEFTDNIKRLALELTNLQRAAANAGVSAGNLKTYMNVGRALGLDPSQVASSITNMRQQIAQFRVFAGSNPLVVQALKQAGINVGDIDKPGGMENVLSKINKYANDLRRQGVKQPEITARLGAFGFSPDVATMFSLPEQKFAELMASLKKYAPTENEIQKMKDLQEAIGKVEAAFDKIGYMMGADLAPLLQKMLKSVQDFVDWMGQFAGRDPKKIAEDQNKRYGTEGKTGAQRLWEWYQGGGVGRALENINPIGGAHAAPTSGSEATPPRVGAQGAIGIPQQGGTGSNALADARASRIAEINANPKLKSEVLKMLELEESKGNGRTAAMEVLLNRSMMVGNTIDQELHSGFYSTVNSGRSRGRQSASERAASEEAFNRAAGGSNVAVGRNDQGMRGDPNANGPGRIPVPGTTGIFNYWQGKRGGRFYSHEDSARYAAHINELAGKGNVWESGTGAMPFSDWLTNPQTRNLMSMSANTTTNNRTSNQVNVGNVNVHTQATDAQGIVRDLKPLLTNDLYTQPFNYGPN